MIKICAACSNRPAGQYAEDTSEWREKALNRDGGIDHVRHQSRRS